MSWLGVSYILGNLMSLMSVHFFMVRACRARPLVPAFVHKLAAALEIRPKMH